jgi:hypothetical protein
MLRFVRLMTLSLALASPVAVANAATTPAKQYLVITDPSFSGQARDRMTQLGLTHDGISLAALEASNADTLRAGYRAIYLPSVADDGQLTRVRPLVAVGGVLERFVNGGGTLVLVLTGYTNDQTDIAPAGVDVVRNGPHNQEAILTPTHPYFTGIGYNGTPLGVGAFGTWRPTDLGTLGGLPEGAKVLLRNEHGPSLVEYGYGRGRVLVTTLSYGWPGFPSRIGPAWNNLLLYVGSSQPTVTSSTTGSTAGSTTGTTVIVEKVPPKATITSLGVQADGRPLYRVSVEDPDPSSGLAQIKLEGTNYQVVGVNGRLIAAQPLPYTDSFAPGSNVTTWEILLGLINLRNIGSLTVTATDHAGNRGTARR